MGDKLANPPVVEAICEFRFRETTPWDWTIPGQLYDMVKTEFADRADVAGVGVELPLGLAGQLPQELRGGPQRVQLKRHDGSAMIQVGQHLVAVNQLRPYATWESFRGLILRIHGYCRDIAGALAPARVGLRYINHLPVPDGQFRIEDYLTTSPQLAEGLDQPLRVFYQRYELIEEAPPGILIHQTGDLKAAGRTVLALDLDFCSEQVGHLVDTPQVGEWLDLAHDRILRAFVASIPPSLYRRLKGDGV